MHTPLLPCPQCKRHIKAKEQACPFCQATLPPSFTARSAGGALALAVGAALALGACPQRRVQPLYGSPAVPEEKTEVAPSPLPPGAEAILSGEESE